MINENINVKRILPELYKQCYQKNLTEYLKLLSHDVLINIEGYIVRNGITDDIKPIYDAVINEIEYRNDYEDKKILKRYLENITIYKKALKSLYNNCLTDYLKTLSDEQLDNLEFWLNTDDLLGDRVKIYEELRLEKEYRKSNIELEFQRIIKKYKK